MRIYNILDKKKRNESLSYEEIEEIVAGFTKGFVPDYQMSALLMAISINGMTEEETSFLTKAMAESGEELNLSSIEVIKVDKHSTGGVGDSTTLITAPIVAACGVPVAKMSGRGLGHTGGTIDKLESITGFQTELSIRDFIDQVNDIGISIVGQTANLAPADKKIYALRDVTATVDSIPLIASSIMSKKIAAGADKIVLDVKVGKGAFMKTKESARKLAETMVAIGKKEQKETIALTTNMNAPLGNAIGNNLEVIEAIHILNGEGPKDLKELSITLAAYMLFLAKKGRLEDCQDMAYTALHTKKGLAKLEELVKAQNGDISLIRDPNKFPKATYQVDIISKEEGYVREIDSLFLGKASGKLGAGREVANAKIDFTAGIYTYIELGKYIKKGEKVLTLFSNDEEDIEEVAGEIAKAITLGTEPMEKEALIFDVIT